MQSETVNVKGNWWTAYFVLVLLASIASLFTGNHSPSDLVLSVFFSFGLVGLWGFIRNVAIGWRPFWIGYFILVMVGVLYSLGLLVFGPALDADFLLLAGVAYLFTFPQWVALWSYAFRSPGIWRDSASGS